MSSGANLEAGGPRAPLGRSTLWPYVLLALGLLMAGLSSWQPVPAGVWHDDGVYMLIGKALAGGDGLTYSGVVGTPPAAKFPPLYPTFLASLWWLFGSIGPVTLAATLLNLVFLAIAGGLFAKVLHSRAGLPLGLSILSAGVAFAATDVIRTALVPLSEPLFLLLVMAALLVRGEEDADTGTRPTAMLALLLVAAVATRTAGVAIVVAVGVPVALRSGLRRAAWTAGPAALVAAIWSFWASLAARDIPGELADLLGPYGGWLIDQTLAAPLAFLGGLPTHAQGVLERIAALLLPGLTGWALWVAAVPLATLAAIGLVQQAKRFPPVAWFVFAYLGLLLIWPYLDRRLVVPLHPFIVGAIAVGGLTLFERLDSQLFRRALIGVAVLWVGSFTTVTSTRIATGWPAAAYRLRAEQLATGVEALRQTVPADAVVGAPEFWAALHLHGGWQVAPSVRFDPRSVDPSAPMWGTPAEQHALWRTAGIDYLLLERGGTLHGAALDALEAGCPESVFILARMPPLAVVQLAWDAGCTIGGA